LNNNSDVEQNANNSQLAASTGCFLVTTDFQYSLW